MTIADTMNLIISLFFYAFVSEFRVLRMLGKYFTSDLNPRLQVCNFNITSKSALLYFLRRIRNKKSSLIGELLENIEYCKFVSIHFLYLTPPIYILKAISSKLMIQCIKLINTLTHMYTYILFLKIRKLNLFSLTKFSINAAGNMVKK